MGDNEETFETFSEDFEKSSEKLSEDFEKKSEASKNAFKTEESTFNTFSEEANHASDGEPDDLVSMLQSYEEEEQEEENFDFEEGDLNPDNWEEDSRDTLQDELKEHSEASTIEEEAQELVGSETMKRLGTIVFEKLDYWRAKLCSSISGEHPTFFDSDKETKELVLLAFKEYLASIDVKEPSPFVKLIIALAAWSLPSLMMAFLMRKKNTNKPNSKADITPQKQVTRHEQQAEETQEFSQAEALHPTYDSPYKELPEYLEGRKTFKVHGNVEKGTSKGYMYSPDGKLYRRVDWSDERPSPIVLDWLKEGKNNNEIKELLYGS